MLFLHQANRLENLFTLLLQQRATVPADPFTAETIVVQNPGMARWLSQQIAIQQTIAANIEFPLPARFIWDIISAQGDNIQEDLFFTHQVMLWRILNLLPQLITKDKFSKLKNYLTDDHNLSKAYQLSATICDLFDQYLVYRPQMLLDWENEQEVHWQACLWRELTTTSFKDTTSSSTPSLSSNVNHRARLVQQFKEQHLKNQLTANNLPQTAFIFGVSSLAPVYLDILSAISSLIDIHIFHLNPCRNFWEDLISDKELAKRRTRWRRKGMKDASEYFDSGNSLLASIGKVGAEFNRQLMDLELIQEENYHSASGDTLLNQIQNDILDLRDPSDPQCKDKFLLSQNDRSVQFHICHSPLREIQVLHDRLLRIFEKNPDLEPGDVLIMAPDIERYTAAITGIWGNKNDDITIPWSLSDRSYTSELPIISTFLELLDIFDSQFTAPEVLALLESEAIRHRFNILEQDLARIRTWIQQTGICWGLDKDHRHTLGIENSNQNTWSFGLNRMLSGYINGSQEDLSHNILPWPGIRDSEADLLGNFINFFSQLQKSHKDFSQNHSPHNWCLLLSQVLTDFFLTDKNDSDQKSATILRELINEFSLNCEKAGFQEDISLSVIQTFFKEKLTSSYGGQAFLSGKVTFCNMVPMRSIPFRVICLLGMNDGDYPRTQHPPSFDLLSAKPMIGDRNRRNDDCYLFLESLLSARDIFYLSWTGHSQNDNSELTPSIMVDELRHYIDRSCNTETLPPSKQLSTEYPLQPFSSNCYQENSSYHSYSATWFPGNQNIQSNFIFLPQNLPFSEKELYQLDIKTLARFWSHPVRFFLQERIGLHLWENDTSIPEKESFTFNYLEQYSLGDNILQAKLRGVEPDTIFMQLKGSGHMPHNNFGKNLFENIQQNLLPMTEELKQLLVHPVTPMEIAITIENFTINGWMDNLYSNGRITYRNAKLKVKDLLQLWIHHLALCLDQTKKCHHVSMHVATDCTVFLLPVQDPQAELQKLLQLYLAGLSQPLHFYPETSLAWFKAENEKKSQAAEKSWNGGYWHQGEKEDNAYKIALQGDCALDNEFIGLTKIFSPLFKHLKESDAKT